jgi:hypothetical protein
MNNDTSSQPHAIPTLLRELRDETTTLLRQEVTLAKTELNENFSHLLSHSLHIAIGAFVAYAGVIVLLIGIGQLLGALLVRAGVDAGVATWAAPSFVGLVVAIIGWAMVNHAKNSMTHEDLVPRQTVESLRENKQWAQNKLRHSS